MAETGTDDLGTVGKYSLRRVLGKGAMGVVYEAYDPMIERAVALKTIRKDLWEADDGEELKERFLREARAAGRLVHPNIVTVYEFGEDGGGAYIVMEHVRGRTLKEMIDGGKRFWPEEAVDLILPVLSALGYSHRAGVIHRDIKPANLMVTDDGQVKVLDFGVARLASASITQVGTILGTPAYMSPEQLFGQTVDARADLYSVGVILCELLTGHKVFIGDYGAVLHQVLHNDPPKPSAINPAVPPSFDTIVARAMARQADERFASADDFIQALREAPTIVSSPTLKGGEHQPAPKAKSSLAVPLVAALAVAAIGAGAAAYGLGYIGGPTATVVAEAPVADKAPEPVKEAPPEPAPVPVPEPEPDPVKETPPEPAPQPEPKPEPEPEPVKQAEPAPEPVKEAQPEPPPADVAALPDLASLPPDLLVISDRGTTPRYLVGESMEISVSSDQQVEVYCFYQQASGEIMRVFPTRFATDATVAPRQVMKLPGEQPFAFKFDTAQVREEVRCVAARDDLAGRMPDLLGGDGFTPLPVPSLNWLTETLRRAADGKAAVAGVAIIVE